MNNEKKLILGTGVVIGAIVLIARSAKGAEPNPEPTQTLYTLTVLNNPTIGGAVASGNNNYVSTITANAGTTIELLASPFTDYAFDRWSGDVSGTNPVISITMDSDKTITANFKYTPPSTLPTVFTDPANNITHTEADLHGGVSNMGTASTVLVAFMFGETTNYEMAPSPTQQITFAMPFSAHVTGLVPGRTYHYKVLASADGHTVYGEDQTFTAAPLTTTNGFTLAVVNPGPNDTLFWFDFLGDLMWEPGYMQNLPKPGPIDQILDFPLFIPGGTILRVMIGHGTRQPDGSYINGGLNYSANFPIDNARNYVFNADTRTLSVR